MTDSFGSAHQNLNTITHQHKTVDLLVFVMSFVTLSFLVTTPECWVPDRGGPEHGFSLLSGAGRLVVKDAIMMGAALVTMADSAKAYLRQRVERAPVANRATEAVAA
jgi:reactive chlorine resistance protein C